MSVKYRLSAKKAAVLLGLSALALAVIIGSQISRQSLVNVADQSGQPASADSAQASASATTPVNPAAPATSPVFRPPVSQPDLTLGARSSLHTHSHDHDEAGLPQALAAEIERRRIPQSQLLLTPNRHGGYSMDAKGQYHTVIVAFIDENGQLRTEERIVYPIPDQPATTLPVPQALRPPQVQQAPISPATAEPAKP